MIFKPEMIEKILAGDKTVTRRPVKESSSLHGDWRAPCKYKAGKDYAVQPGRGQKAVGRLRILDVHRGLIAGVDNEEANLEGFRHVEDFRNYWIKLYGSYNPTQLVDRIEFELVQ